MSRLKEIQKQIITKEANTIFLKEGIANSSVASLAKEIGVGEATLYRYYKKKENLVIDCAILNLEQLYNKYFVMSESLEGLSGYEKVATFYKVYEKIFVDDKDFLSFIGEFDNYALEEHLSPDDLAEYNALYAKIKSSFDTFYEEGEKDGSIREGLNRDLFYFTMSKGLLLLTRKLAMQPLIQSDTIDSLSQLQLYIDVSLYYLKGTQK